MQANDFKRNFSLITAGALFAGVFACGMANAQPSMQQQRFQQVAGGLQTIQAMDPQVGLPALSIAIPQGWTHQFQSTWNKNNDPMVMFEFEARNPRGAGRFYISTPINFYDMPQFYGKTAFFQKLMPPRQAFEYVQNLVRQSDPAFRAKGYRVVQSQDFPPVDMNGGRIFNSKLWADYTENGVPMQELLDVMVVAAPPGTVWTLAWNGLSDRKGVPREALADRLAAISRTVQILPQWQQQQVAFSAQGSAEVIAKSNAIRDQGNAMTRQLEAQGDAARQANMASFRRRMESKERVSQMQTDATTGRDNRINPYTGGQFKSDVNVKDVWVSSDGRTISTNDSTYNPNYDSNVSGDWKLAPKGY